MKLEEALREECLLAGAVLAGKDDALREVARRAKLSVALRDVDEEQLVRGLQAREALGSTGVGGGIAIPHCRLADVADFVVGMLTVPGGVEFDSVDDEPVKLIIFIIAPEKASNEHIRLLSEVSRTLHGPHVVREIVGAKTPEVMLEVFLRSMPAEGAVEEHAGKNMFHVFVQDETVFHEILQVFAAMESCSVVVVPAQNLGVYLARMPLFAGFWREEPGGFSQVIVAAVDKGLTNETIRSIQTLTGGLADRSGVMLTVQETFYSAGSLTT